jgi:adhesin/invasin
VTGVVANGLASSTITATLKDAYGNLVSGTTVTFAATGGGTAFGANGVVSDGSGVASTTLTATSSGSKGVTATAAGVLLNDNPSVNFTGCPSVTALTAGGAPIAGDTTAGTHLYTPTCAGTDSPENVYGFSLGGASSVILDRGASATAGSVTDLRPQLITPSGCSSDAGSYACSSSRYTYCPNLAAGSYQAVIDSKTGAGVSYSLSLTTAAAKASKSYGVITTSSPTFTTIAGAGGATVMAADLVPAVGKYVTTTLPFAFTYFGTAYPAGTTITLYQSGYLSFDATVVNTFQNVTLLPNGTTSVPPNTILPYWGRLAAYQNSTPNLGSIWTQTQGSAPNRIFVVEWADFDGCTTSTIATCNGGTAYEYVQYSFQVLLYETGEIEFRYKPYQEDQGGSGSTANRGFASGAYQTIGLQSTGGVVGVEQVAFNVNGAGTGGTGAVGTCTPIGGFPDGCSAVTTGYLFVPRAANCP